MEAGQNVELINQTTFDFVPFWGRKVLSGGDCNDPENLNQFKINDPENLNQFKIFKLAKIVDFKYLK